MELLKLYLDFTIFGILGLMGFIALWITIERLFFFKRLNLNEFTKVELFHVSITKNLTTMSTVRANAPYVGLLGTVLGILITFYDLGQQQTIDTGSIMTGLALALKATAAGIALAIPAIMSYNGLMRRCDVIELQFKAKQA